MVNVCTVVRGLALSAFALVVLAGARPASSADVPRHFAKLERVDVEPYLADLTRVRVFLNLLHIEGKQIDNVKPEELQLVVGDARLKAVPGIARFETEGEHLDLVVVIEVHSSFVSALADLEEPLEKIIARLPSETSRVAIVAYGEKVKASLLEPPAAAARRWRRVVPDDVPEPPVLVEAVGRAIRILSSASAPREGVPTRKVVLVISDGNALDAQTLDTMDDFRKLTKQANAADVTIHTLGFSLADNRELLRNLAELSKKTHGTMRWAQTRADLGTHLDAINTELRRQMVLTYLLPGAEAVSPGSSVGVICRSVRCGGTLESNRRRAPKPMCAGSACTVSQACVAGACRTVELTGGGGSSAGVIAVVIGLLAAAGTGAVVVKKKGGKAKAGKAGGKAGKAGTQAGASAPQPGAPPPGAGAPMGAPQIVLPDFSNMPYVGNSAAAQQMHQQLAHLPYVGQAMAAQQAAAQQAAVPQAVAGATRVPSLMVLSGPMQGKMFPLRHGFTVGKLRGCDLILEDGFTSGHHAQFHLDTAGGCTVVDLGSTNGIFVNGVRATSQRLHHGMSVRVGQTELRFLQG